MQVLGNISLAHAPRYLRQLADHLDRDLSTIVGRGILIHGDYILKEGQSVIEWHITEEESKELRDDHKTKPSS